MAYVPSLPDKIFEMLDQQASLDQLTWHDGAIPSDEVWVKIGGDKGGGTFKMNFHICNVAHPNSPTNTCIFSIFMAYDSVTNLHIGLDRYKDQVRDLQEMKWRDKTIKLFLSGDYELLCKMYGISGASGRHCCLLCHIDRKDLKDTPCLNALPEFRSLLTLALALASFETQGKGDLSVAKEHFNVISQPFFDIPLNQVCIPGLHISLGIFYRLFSLLENSVHCLDFQIAPSSNLAQQSSAAVDQYVKDLQSLTHLKEERDRVEEKAAIMEQVLTLSAVNQSDDITITPLLVTSMLKEAAKLRKELEGIDKSIADLEKVVKKGFDKCEGPFVTALDKALATFNVQRQAYYSGTFVGNHVNRCLKPKNVDTLLKAVTDTAEELESTLTVTLQPPLTSQAQAISRQFTMTFTLFANCHNIYNTAKKLSEDDIESLERNIKDFMAFYRETFPSASVLPKMHLLEVHTVPWLKEHGVGLGLMGEQGAESIHASINSIKKAYSNVPDRVKRLEYILLEHHRHVCPTLVKEQPAIKKRKLSKNVEE